MQVLIADFFFILFSLGWLGVGLAERSALQSTVRVPPGRGGRGRCIWEAWNRRRHASQRSAAQSPASH